MRTKLQIYLIIIELTTSPWYMRFGQNEHIKRPEWCISASHPSNTKACSCKSIMIMHAEVHVRAGMSRHVRNSLSVEKVQEHLCTCSLAAAVEKEQHRKQCSSSSPGRMNDVRTARALCGSEPGLQRALLQAARPACNNAWRHIQVSGCFLLQSCSEATRSTVCAADFARAGLKRCWGPEPSALQVCM